MLVPDLSGIEPDNGTPVALSHAIRYAVANGWRVFPCEPRGKRPLVKWRDEATTDPAIIRAWWDAEPHANLAVCTGDGLIVIDIDGTDGARTYDLLTAHVGPLPATLTASTGRGRHLYFRADGIDVRNSAGKLGPGVDVRGEGGYVIAPPSTHPSGARYAWEHASSDIARLPDAWAAKLTEPHRNDAPDGTETTADDDRTIPAGQRNDFLWRTACRLRRNGLAYPALLAALHAENVARCRPVCSAASVEAIARRAQDTYTATDPIISAVVPNGDGTFTITGTDRPAPDASESDDNPEQAGDLIDAMIPAETWGEFRDIADDDVAYLIRDLWPAGGLGLIAAPPKARKTWLALYLAICLATGKPFLGRDAFDMDGVPVLYVALEGHRTALKHRIGAIARGMGVDPDTAELDKLHITYKPRGIDLSHPSWANALHQRAGRMDAQLVIVDVLRAAASFDENKAKEWNALRANLVPILDDGRSLALLHHFGKLSDTNKERSVGERGSGSGAMYGAIDIGLYLVSPAGSETTTVEIITRDLAAPDALGFGIEGDGSGPNGGYIYRDECRIVEREAYPEATKITLVGGSKAAARRVTDDDLADRVRDYVLAVSEGPSTQVRPVDIITNVPGVDKPALGRMRKNDTLKPRGVGYSGQGNAAHYHPL